jgi:hypothetical protein
MFDSRRYGTLHDLIDDMEIHEANAVPVTLLDMYPKQTNNSYVRGSDFLIHSPYFDDLNSEYYESTKSIYEIFRHRIGGVRKRVLGTRVCIHKFPLFKYNFYPIGVAPGYHFFQLDGNVLRQTDEIRLHNALSVLLHFKFIKRNFPDFVQQRIVRNEDWGDSQEYRSYMQALGGRTALQFFDEKYSRKLTNIEDLRRFLKNLPIVD